MTKRVLFIVLLQFFVNCIFSQTKNDSIYQIRDLVVQLAEKFLTVKGVELKPGMKMDELSRLFESKGWKKTEMSDYAQEKFGVIDMKGMFFNRYDCGIQILPTASNANIVGKIGIEFPDKDFFRDLLREYNEIKTALSKKYHLVASIESFDQANVENSSSDYLKLRALKNKEATFESTFHVDDKELSILLGSVTLRITNLTTDYDTRTFVFLKYCTSDDIIDDYLHSDDDL